MHHWFTAVAFILVLIALPYFRRVLTGPSVFDRLVALNAIGTLIPLFMVMIGLIYRRLDMFVDLAIAILLLNMFVTMLIAHYVRSRRIQKRG